MKNARQQKILELIQQYHIDTQETLIEKLKESGFSVTQTTVSRDINQLKLIKAISPDGSYKYVIPRSGGEGGGTVINSALTDAVVKVEAARNIVVVKTYSGMANAVAVCVDSLGRDEIIGSVAGDDTILIVLKNDEIAASIEKRLKSVFNV